MESVSREKEKRLLDSAPGQLWLAKTRDSCHQVDMGLSDVSNPRNTKRITNRRFTTNSIRDDTDEAPPVEHRPTEPRCLVGQWPCPWSGSPLSSPHVYQLNHVFISLRNRRHCPPCHVELVAPFFSFPEIQNHLAMALSSRCSRRSMCLSSAEQGLQPYRRPWGDLS
jgi:hypothetical protein